MADLIYPIHATTDIRLPDLGNTEAREGSDRCWCGCKYWERDRCIDCGTYIRTLLADPAWRAENRGERPAR